MQQINLPIYLDRHEHFPKQTYRNRAVIHSPNGKLNLIVPVVKGSKVHTPVKDVKISYEFDWQRLHWLSLQTSYRSSAYFEFYEDELAPFYHKKWDFLADYTYEILQFLAHKLKIVLPVHQLTEHYLIPADDWLDYRESIHPKKADNYTSKPYFQVFESRNGFLPNLSVVDLLFNQGPQSSVYF